MRIYFTVWYLTSFLIFTNAEATSCFISDPAAGPNEIRSYGKLVKKGNLYYLQVHGSWTSRNPSIEIKNAEKILNTLKTKDTYVYLSTLNSSSNKIFKLDSDYEENPTCSLQSFYHFPSEKKLKEYLRRHLKPIYVLKK